VKRRIWRTLPLLLAIVVLLVVSVSAETISGTCGDSATWSFDPETGVLTIGGTGVLDTQVNSANYVEVPWKAYADDITSIVVCEGITEIQRYTFQSLKNVGTVQLPASLTYIYGDSVFGSASAFSVADGSEHYEAKAGVLFQIADGGANDTTPASSFPKLVRFPTGKTGAYKVPSGTNSIHDRAFYGCTGVTAVEIPDRVGLGSYAFSGCTSLKSIDLPGNRTQLPQGLLNGCTALESVVIPDSVQEIDTSVFNGCKALKTVSWSASLKYIRTNAFYGCTSLQEANLKSVNEIGRNAFTGCTKLKKVNLPEGLTYINEYAFSGCSLLTKLDIPASLTKLFITAFEDTMIANVNVHENNTKYSSIDGVLFNKDQTTLLWYPRLRYGEYTVPDSITTIGANAFDGCGNLTAVHFGSALTKVGDYAFKNCIELERVEFGKNLTAIGTEAFYMSGFDYKLTDAYFRGPAPTLGTNGFTQGSKIILYFVEGQEGWTSPSWKGYKTATWIPEDVVTYTVTFDAQGGIGGATKQTKEAGVDLTLSSTVPYKEGYTFLGWATEADAEEAAYQPGDLYTEDADLTLYALWEIEVYTISFDANGGEHAPSAVEKTYGVNITLPKEEPERIYHTFLGWSSDQDAVLAEYSSGGTYKENGDVTLYAVWKDITYTVTYDANGGTDAPAVQTKTAGVDLTLSARIPTRQGYTFLGWAAAKNALEEEYLPEDIYTGDSSITLYAVWQYVNVGTDGVVTLSSATAEPGETITLTASIANNQGLAGYIFEIRADLDVFSVAATDEELHITPGTVCQSGSFLTNTFEKGWKVMWYHTANVKTDGDLFTIELTVAEDAPEKEYTIELLYSADDTVNVEGELVPLSVVNSTVTVCSRVVGDVNGDGKITNSDVIKLARSLIGLTTLTEEQQLAADVNGDGKITNSDVIKLARSLIGLTVL